MALVVQDPGFRSNEGAANIAKQAQDYGEQAMQRRELVGANEANAIQAAATEAGLSMSDYLRRNPEAATGMRNALYGVTGGNTKLADQMLGRLSSMQATPDQMFNNKIYDALEQEVTADHLFDRTEVTKKVKEKIETGAMPGVELTSDNIKNIVSDSEDAPLWGGIAEYLNIEPTNGDWDNPIWPQEFDDIRENLLQTYLPGTSLEDFKNTTGDDKTNLKRALRAGFNRGQTASDFLKSLQEGGSPSSAVSPDDAQKAMADSYINKGIDRQGNTTDNLEEQALRANQQQLDIYNNLRPEANRSGEPKKLDAYGMQGIAIYPDNYEGDPLPGYSSFKESFGGAREAVETTGKPQAISPSAAVFSDAAISEVPKPTFGGEEVGSVSFYSQPAKVESAPPEAIVEEITRDPGWFSQFNQTMAKVRKQGGIDSQRSLASDVEIRDLEATIEQKGALSNLYKAQYAQSIAALSAPAQYELTDPEKAALDSSSAAYDKLFEMQLSGDFLEKLKSDKSFRELWQKSYDQFAEGLPNVGLSMDYSNIANPKFLNIGGVEVPMLGVLKSTGGGFGGGGASNFTAESLEADLNKVMTR